MTTPVPGPPASVLNAILGQNPADPGSPARRATFSQSGQAPFLPSLMNDVVPMPQDGVLDANGTWTGFLSTLGLAGATAPTRYVGGTASGAPATGTFLAGDFVTSRDGNVYVCTAAGSPGTWAASGGSAAPSGPAGGALTGTYPNPGLATVTLAEGGTGQVTQQAAIDALAGATTSGLVLRGNGTHAVMAAIQAGDLPDLAYVDSVTAADTSIVIGGTSDAPTVATGTLDVIAADHPAAANWSNNSHKITSLANGSAASDAAAFGQLPVLAAADTSVVVAGTATAPTVATGTLDVIAADHPPAANWSNNSHKITSVANGSGAQDAAAYGQTPAGGSTVTIAQGGTGQTAQQAAMDALAGAQTSGQYLRGNGTHVLMAAIAAADLPAGTTSTQGALQLDGTAADILQAGTAPGAGAKGQAADAKHVHPDNAWIPADAGWLGWAYDGALISGQLASASGTIYLVRVNVRAAISVTNVILYIGTVGATLTAGDSFAGLYAGQTAGAFTAGQRIGVTADQATSWSTGGNANSYLTIALASGPFSLPAGIGWAWVAMCSTGTTAPSWGRAANQNAAAANTGLGVSSARFATNGTGTSLPSSITPASNVLIAQALWAGIS